MQGTPKSPTATDLGAARVRFRDKEPRDLFYRVARELIRLSSEGRTEVLISEALGSLLQTWNKSFYRFGRRFDEIHLKAIERTLDNYKGKLGAWKNRDITSLKDSERDTIVEVFTAFENEVGPVGAAKALHLLAPQFFPLWDRAIAARYRLGLRKMGINADRYLGFMEVTKAQVLGVSKSGLEQSEILKMIDEYNFGLVTKGWVK